MPLSLLLRREGPKRDHVDRITGIAGTEQLRMAAFTPRAMQTLLAIAGFGCCVAMSMPQVHIVAYCVDLGYGIARGAEMLSLMLAAGVVSRLASGVLADYIGGVRTLLLGSVLQCVALALYLPFDGLVALYVISFVFGLFQGGIVPSYAIIIREYLPAREAGQRIGLVIFATIGGMAFGGWVCGLDLRPDGVLPGGAAERHGVELRQHGDHDADPLAHHAPARSGGVSRRTGGTPSCPRLALRAPTGMPPPLRLAPTRAAARHARNLIRA